MSRVDVSVRVNTELEVSVDLDDIDFGELCDYVDSKRGREAEDPDFREIADLIKTGNKDQAWDQMVKIIEDATGVIL